LPRGVTRGVYRIHHLPQDSRTFELFWESSQIAPLGWDGVGHIFSVDTL
jgi:hypothetical protein